MARCGDGRTSRGRCVEEGGARPRRRRHRRDDRQAARPRERDARRARHRRASAAATRRLGALAVVNAGGDVVDPATGADRRGHPPPRDRRVGRQRRARARGPRPARRCRSRARRSPSSPAASRSPSSRPTTSRASRTTASRARSAPSTRCTTATRSSPSRRATGPKIDSLHLSHLGRPRRRGRRARRARRGPLRLTTPMNADLARYSPWLRYDSQESFRADSAATLTDSIGKSGPNVLKRKNGTVLAKAGAGLSLDFLGSYGGPTRDDFLDAVGRDYVADARRLHAKPAVRRPHLRPRGQGPQGRHVAAVLVLLLLQRQAVPRPRAARGRLGDDPAAPRRRRGAGRRHLRPARAGRALRAGAASRRTPTARRSSTSRAARTPRCCARAATTRPIVPDECDAKGPLVRPALEELTAPWAAWPGLWGSTKAGSPLESSSPRGPAQHSQYTDPLSKHEAAKDCQGGRPRRADDGRRCPRRRSRELQRARCRTATPSSSGHRRRSARGGDARPLARLARRRAAAGDLPRRRARPDRQRRRCRRRSSPASRYFVIGRAVSEDGIASEPAYHPVRA